MGKTVPNEADALQMLRSARSQLQSAASQLESAGKKTDLRLSLMQSAVSRMQSESAAAPVLKVSPDRIPA
jgi:hypothetical protein